MLLCDFQILICIGGLQRLYSKDGIKNMTIDTDKKLISNEVYVITTDDIYTVELDDVYYDHDEKYVEEDEEVEKILERF